MNISTHPYRVTEAWDIIRNRVGDSVVFVLDKDCVNVVKANKPEAERRMRLEADRVAGIFNNGIRVSELREIVEYVAEQV